MQLWDLRAPTSGEGSPSPVQIAPPVLEATKSKEKVVASVFSGVIT